MNTLVSDFESNRWFLAIAILVSNLGINYLTEDLKEQHKKILNNCYLRKIYMFALIFCGTKSLMISLIATFIYSVIVHWI